MTSAFCPTARPAESRSTPRLRLQRTIAKLVQKDETARRLMAFPASDPSPPFGPQSLRPSRRDAIATSAVGVDDAILGRIETRTSRPTVASFRRRYPTYAQRADLQRRDSRA